MNHHFFFSSSGFHSWLWRIICNLISKEDILWTCKLLLTLFRKTFWYEVCVQLKPLRQIIGYSGSILSNNYCVFRVLWCHNLKTTGESDNFEAYTVRTRLSRLSIHVFGADWSYNLVWRALLWYRFFADILSCSLWLQIFFAMVVIRKIVEVV